MLAAREDGRNNGRVRYVDACIGRRSIVARRKAQRASARATMPTIYGAWIERARRDPYLDSRV